MRANLVGSSVVSAITQTPASGPAAPTTVPPISVAPTVTACCAKTAVGIALGSAIKPAHIVNRASALVTNIARLPTWNRLFGRFFDTTTLAKRSAAFQSLQPAFSSAPGPLLDFTPLKRQTPKVVRRRGRRFLPPVASSLSPQAGLSVDLIRAPVPGYYGFTVGRVSGMMETKHVGGVP